MISHVRDGGDADKGDVLENKVLTTGGAEQCASFSPRRQTPRSSLPRGFPFSSSNGVQ